MNTQQSDGIFSKYVNVRVMLSIMLSILLSAIMDLLMTDPPKIDYVYQLLPFVYVVFVMYLIIYLIESIPSIANWFVSQRATNVPVGGK